MITTARSSRNRLYLTISLCLCASSAFAQQTDPNDKRAQTNAAQEKKGEKNSAALETITVTARQRSESAQNVPITITAFTAQQIQDAGIKTPADFVQMTPNVSMVQAQSAGTDFMTIRGITQVRNGQPPVATVVDGVQLVSPNQFNQQLFDLEDIEVLKGPQGALYGRNAIGGAILMTTKEPTDTTSAWVGGSLGNGDLRSGSFSLSGPIGEGRARYLVSGLDSFFGGLIDNSYLNKPVDNQRNQGLRARLVYDVSENFKLDAQASAMNTIGAAVIYVFQPLFGVNDPNNTSIPITSNNKGYNKRMLDHVSLKGDYETSLGTLSGVAAYDHVSEMTTGDQFPYSPAISANSPFGPGTDGGQTQYLATNARQAEVRFTSPGDRPLRWIVGASWLGIDRYLSTTTSEDLGFGVIPIEKTPAGPGTRNPTLTFIADDNHENYSSVFGQLAYDFRPELEAALAWRYDDSTHDQVNAAPKQFDAYSGTRRSTSSSKFQPKITMTWKPNGDFSLFGSYGEGFRPGGFNQSGTGAAAEKIGLFGLSDLYRAESTRSAEVGFKTLLADHRLQIDGSVFNTRDSNQLYFVFVGQIGAQVLTNIDRVDLNGFELSAKYKLLDDLTVYGAYGRTNSEIKSYALTPADVGNRAPYTPGYTSNVGLQYSPHLTSALDGLFRVDYERVGQQYWDPENLYSRKTVPLLNLHLGVQSGDGKWSATLWALNATNTKYNAEYVVGGFAQIAAPRTFGIDFRYNFF